MQNLTKITPPPATSTIDPFDDDIHKDSHLFDQHMFYHIIGLSNLRRILAPKALELDLSLSDCEDSFVKEDSYDNLKAAKESPIRSSSNNITNKPATSVTR